MFTSRTERRIWKIYTLWAVVCAVFAAVYEYFSHGVISLSMMCFPLVPLIGGLPFLFFRINKKGFAVQMWHCSNASFALALLLHGILEIYGTGDVFSVYMLIAGAVLAVFALPGFFRRKNNYTKTKAKKNTVKRKAK